MATTITRDLLKVLRTEIDAALAGIAAKHDVSLKMGNATFTDTNATLKVVLATKGDGGVVITKEMATLKAYMSVLGVTEEMLTKPFSYSGKMFVLAGYKSRNNRFVIKEVATGKMFVAGREGITAALGIKTA